MGSAVMDILADVWYIGASTNEIGDRPLARRVCNEPLVFFRGASGAIVALEDRCPHRKAPLSFGSVTNGEIACGYHGLRLNEQGVCTWAPLQGNEPPRLAARKYPTVERFGYIFVWMGASPPADTSGLPSWEFMEQGGWTDFRGYHYVRGHYQLVCDNLLDLTHLPFVHAETLGRMVDASLYLSPQKTWVEGDAVHTHRDAGSTSLRPMDPPEVAAGLPEGVLIGRSQNSQFYSPSFVTVGFEGWREDQPENRFATHYVVNGVTPETSTSCHYFWAVVHRANPAAAEFYRNYHALTIKAFDEDQRMIEAQQARMLDDPAGGKLVDLGGDLASRHARGVVRRNLARPL
jgi:vanillate monooxygenase